MKVLMIPHALSLQAGESGIHTLVRKYFEHLPTVGIELVSPKATSFDVMAVHAGMTNAYPSDGAMVSHLHGLYWTGDYRASSWEYKANAAVIESIRQATLTTVPSAWVAEAIQRDMHFSPQIVPHGIDWQEWQHEEPNDKYVLWNKNRTGDVCDPAPIAELAKRFPQQRFLTTFAPPDATPNIKSTGIVRHAVMRQMVQRAGVYLATTKETFGIGMLEAMASGVPVLGFAHGGAVDLVRHGVNGYLARPGDYDDLARGLDYCNQHRAVLGANGLELVKTHSWANVAQHLYNIYGAAQTIFSEPSTVGVVIPCYNYADKLERAVDSVMAQTHAPHDVIIVDNNSSDNTTQVAKRLIEKYADHGARIIYVNEERQGVAHARNRGVTETNTKYVCCMDADDAIEPGFLAACVQELDADRGLGVAYTRLRWIKGDGSTGVSDWPSDYNYDSFLKKQNQVPTCCVYRREMWQRLGGYRQRYAPHGAGAEDAEFFLRAGANGWRGKLASKEPLFVYSWGTGRVSGDKQYREADWLGWHPWINDHKHPFASVATPHQFAHEVRQYDEPVISVVIPVGPNHERYLVDALDSLEAQTFRKWEAIVVFDDGRTHAPVIMTSYPYARTAFTNQQGAGAARNKGASMARGALLLFLDADDWLRPTALEKMLRVWNAESSIVYSDYAGHAYMENGLDVERLRIAGRLYEYDERTREAVIAHAAYDYDCEEAILQPRIFRDGQFYIWSLITSLVPKMWHDEIGGFDESMPSWEDWDYWIRLARSGRCFTRIVEPLVDYRFYSGNRRETGRQIHESLLKYMQDKYRERKVMPCSGCSKNRVVSQAPAMQAVPRSMNAGMVAGVGAGDIVFVRYTGQRETIIGRSGTRYGERRNGEVFKMLRQDIHGGNLQVLENDARAHAMIVDGNIGNHLIIGDFTKRNYGYHKSGDILDDVSVVDILIAPRKFQSVPGPEAVMAAVVPAPVAIVEPPKPITAVVAEPEPLPQDFATWEPTPAFDFTSIWGINEERSQTLVEMGVRTIDGLLTMGEARLATVLGVTPKVAKRIVSDAESKAA